MFVDFKSYIETETLLGDRYRILDIIGNGATGWVIKAEDKLLADNIVALKFLHSHLVLSDNSNSRFKKESRVTMKLSHPNIVKTYGTGRIEGIGTYLEMEFVAGRSLKSFIEDNESYPITEELFLEILWSTAIALEYAHSCGVVHRDLKPDNIMIREDGEVFVADFGLAQTLREDSENITRVGDILGTPHYMSPEQFRSEAVDGLSDMYSFALVAYNLATRRLAFDADSFIELATRHLNEPLPVISEFSNSFNEKINKILQRCAEKEKSARFESMEDLCRELEESFGKRADFDSIRIAGDTEIRQDSLPLDNGPLSAAVVRRFAILGYSRGVGAFLVLFVFLLFMTRTRPAVNRRVASYVLMTENQTGWNLELIRALLKIDVRMGDVSPFFNIYAYKEKVTPLLEAGADPNIHYGEKNETPLHFWMARSIFGFAGTRVSALLAYGADVNAVDRNGDTPLHVAAEHGSIIGMRLLLEHPDLKDINAKNKLGQTALHLSVIHRKTRELDELINQGADVNIADRDGNTALHLATMEGNVTSTQRLIGAGAFVNLPNIKGETAEALVESLSFHTYRRDELISLVSKGKRKT